jgi:hypothetical protein
MNCKTALQKYVHRTQSGFVLAIAIGAGLVLVVIGISMVLRSQNDHIAAMAQKTKARSLSAAETGVSRVQGLFSQYRSIGRYPACTSWSVTGCSDAGATQSWFNVSALVPNAPDLNCGSPDGKTLVPLAATQSWQAIDPSDATKGQYRLLDYTYDSVTKQGMLTVEGRVDPGGSGNNIGASITRLAVKIPVAEASPADGVPAVWIRQSPVKNIGNDKMKGNLFVSGCALPIGAGQPTSNNLSDPNLFNVVAIPKAFPDIKDPPTSPAPQDLTNPWQKLPEDPKNPPPKVEGRYQYAVKTLNGTTKNILKIATDANVDLYVDGDISLQGEAALNPDGEPSQLRIFGTSNTQKIEIRSTGRVNAFVLAPEATASIDCQASCTTAEGSVRGSLWVNNWDAIGGAAVKVEAVGAYQTYYGSFSAQRDQVSAATLWEQQQVTP